MKRKEIITQVLALYPVAYRLVHMEQLDPISRSAKIVDIIDSMLI